ncbi:hypothetical protein ACFL02_10015 [Planctomycetota bacterium]
MIICTRAAWGGHIIRRRECWHCDKRLTTWEKSIVSQVFIK